jgi:hypothetical protein
MDTISRIELRRQDILEEVRAMRSMERATLNEQMLPVKHKGEEEPVLRGPYYVLVRWEDGKSRSRRVPADEVEQVRLDVANHQRFRDLCREYAELTEDLGRLEREAGAAEQDVKKKPGRRSSRTRR